MEGQGVLAQAFGSEFDQLRKIQFDIVKRIFSRIRASGSRTAVQSP